MLQLGRGTKNAPPANVGRTQGNHHRPASKGLDTMAKSTRTNGNGSETTTPDTTPAETSPATFPALPGREAPTTPEAWLHLMTINPYNLPWGVRVSVIN